MRRQRDIDGRSQSVGPAEVFTKAGSRIKSPAILMNRYAQNIRIIPINILCAVPVMTIGINDGNFFYAIGMTDILNHDCFYVDVAEASRAVRHKHGVMSGRSHQRKGVVHLACKNFLGCGDRAAGGDKMG